ncbi:MAG: TIR domain-containing protein [Bacillota bacterium]|nr:TIR domain-containing protein [Bacillota bacterium]
MITTKIFVIHNWEYHHDYLQLILSLKKMNPRIIDLSIPVTDKSNLQSHNKAIEQYIESRIIESNQVLVLTSGLKVERYWIRKELDLTYKHNKTLISVSLTPGAIPEWIQEYVRIHWYLEK